MEATCSIIATLRREKGVEISIKRKIDPERWDSHANRVKGNKEEAKEVNSLIDTIILKLNKIYNRLIENDEMITATRIKEIYLGKDVRNQTLLEVFKLHNEMVKRGWQWIFRDLHSRVTRQPMITSATSFFTSTGWPISY